MLKLSSITKDYKVADTKVKALKGISLSFRKNEFVSILGPSGCGKTTLLNIIGGLDKYTTGDLSISGRSTKEFKDKDWDVYRNHRIGFIFQSYNLIPHQTVLGNVELALTIAGISKPERVEKAKLALDKVGLSDQYYKFPNQLSGGQCQRVAIARALVNDPDILLADEPTGALDTTTSVQIMELVKEIATEKLVIMVTHNAELAEQYSTRIIRLLDGELQNDSNPYAGSGDKTTAVGTQNRSTEKAKMSFWTAFKLSFQNLLTKKARTTMIGIAGSIGIIGVSLVLSISYGVQAFIGNMQNDMLSGNPVEIRESGIDITSLMRMTRPSDQTAALKEHGYVNVDSMIDYLASRASTAESIMMTNTITQDYIDYILSMSDDYAAAVFLTYGLDVTNNIFTDFKESADTKAETMSLSAIKNVYTSVLEHSPYASYADYVTNLTDIFAQAPNNESYILSQYDMVYGRVAHEKNEIMLVLEKESMLTDLLLAQLGYYTQDEFLNLVFKAAPEADGSANPYYDSALDKEKFTYEELVGRSFAWYPNDDLFIPTSNRYEPFVYNAYDNGTFSDGIELTVVGILEPKESVSYGCLESGIYYTEALTNHIISANKNSAIVTALKNNGQTSTSSGERASSGGLMDGIRATADGVEYLYDGTAQMSEGLHQLADGAELLKEGAAGLTELQRGSRQLNDGARQLSNAMIQYTDSVDQMVAMMSSITTELQTAVRENPQLMQDPNIAGLIQSLGGGEAGLAQMMDVSGQLSEADRTRLMEASEQMREADLAQIMDTSGQRRDTALTQITDASAQLRIAAQQLAAGTGGLNEGLAHLTVLQDGISGLADGIAGLQRGSEGLEEGAKALSDGMADYRTSNVADEEEVLPISVTFQYAYSYLGERFEDVTGYLGSSSQYASLMGSLFSANPQFDEMARMKSLTINQLGGIDRANNIRIYPVDFHQKTFVQEHLDRWNVDEDITFFSASQQTEITLTAEQREDIRYTDNLSLVIRIINNLIDIITFALIGFTSLALVVSCVMIGIITYVSVVERIKEIGVIRSLGGRKRDVSNLFTAETFIIGLFSGLIGIAFTYLGSWIINLIIYAQQGIETIAIFPWYYAAMMVGVSVFLTLVSGFMPSRSAANKDPVVALRTE